MPTARIPFILLILATILLGNVLQTRAQSGPPINRCHEFGKMLARVAELRDQDVPPSEVLGKIRAENGAEDPNDPRWQAYRRRSDAIAGWYLAIPQVYRFSHMTPKQIQRDAELDCMEKKQ